MWALVRRLRVATLAYATLSINSMVSAHHAQFCGMPSCRVYGQVRAAMPLEMEWVASSRIVLSYRKPLDLSTCGTGGGGRRARVGCLFAGAVQGVVG